MPLSQLLKSSDRELKGELHLILNAIVEGLCGVDVDGNVTFCNKALLEMTGYGPEELIGCNLHDTIHHHRSDGTRYPVQECAIYQSIRAHRSSHVKGEFYWRKNGSCFPTECWVHPLTQPLSRTAFVITIQDVTEAQRDKEALRQSEEKFRRILAGVPDVAWTADQQGRIVYLSPKVKTLFGFTKSELCAGDATLWLRRIHREDSSRVRKTYQDLFDKQRAFDQEYRFQRKDGSWIWVHSRAIRTHQENEHLFADGVLSDITRRKQAETELQTKTAFLEAQANSTIDGILVVDENDERLLLNQKLIELFKIPPQVASNKNDRHLLDHVVKLIKDPESFLSKIEYLNQHPAETSRDEIELRDGMILDRYSSPVVGKNGIYYGRIWTFRDITERKRNEDTLQQLSMAVEQSPVSIVITDPQGNISYVNRKFTEITGYTPEEVMGGNPRILNSGQTPAELYHDLWSAISQGREWRGEFCNRKKNGEIYWETANIRPITSSQGAITHYLAIKEDITERRVTQETLKASEKRYRLLFERNLAGVIRTTPEGRVLECNQAAARMFGYESPDEIMVLSSIDLYYDPSEREGVVAQLKAKGSITNLELKCRRKGGDPLWIIANFNFVDDDSTVDKIVEGILVDITERNALESQLRQAQKLESVGQLAAGIAHEVNTPTQFVSDNLTFLRDAWQATFGLLELYRNTIQSAAGALPQQVAAALDEAARNCDFEFLAAEVPRAIDQSLDGSRRVAEIVRAMKEFSHPDSANKTAADLNRAIESTITVARNEWKYVATISTDFDRSLPSVMCYLGDINQVILNLLVNAAHAIKEKLGETGMGQITVRTRRKDTFAEIAVSDTGTGVPEAIRARIFDPFFTTKDVGKGTGQGLALAHNVIVKKHGGKIRFETEMGRGSTFIIELPIQPFEPAAGN
jgi:two-component system, NtrC family, sensor kinase